MYTTTEFVRVDNARTITRQTDFEFYYECQQGVLLALKEQGMLTEMQFKYAQDVLKEQRLAAVRAMVQRGGDAA